MSTFKSIISKNLLAAESEALEYLNGIGNMIAK